MVRRVRSRGDRSSGRWYAGLAALALLLPVGLGVRAAQTVPTDVEMPGTQPLEVAPYTAPESGPGNCANCHANTTNPDLEPSFGWKGSMMAHSARDPLFWAQLAVVEQDFLPGTDPAQRGGAGDFCLRCHMPGGWLQGRSTPTDGSGMISGVDSNGIECEHCHLMVDPDPPVNVAGTVEEQNAPYIANDGSEGFYGSGMSVINSGGTRLGPYANAAALHDFLQSDFMRKSEMCATCHEVSNPVVGDLAHNNGAQLPLMAGTFSGVPGSPVAGKAAFNNPPYKYGVVERTYSEWLASDLSTLEVDDFATLPTELKLPGGSLAVAHDRAFDPGSGSADYADGTTRYYTCQTCHMSASVGIGCNTAGVSTRTDLPRHDLTGSGYWVPEMIKWQDDAGTLRFGGPVDTATRAAMDAGMLRAEAMLKSAANLQVNRNGSDVDVRVVNLTGHKLITGYPEGRRMWLNVRFLDDQGAVLAEEGGYGPIGRAVTDLDGDPFQIESLLDPDNTLVFDAAPGLDQQWASQLLGFGYDNGFVLAYDRLTDQVTETLATLAAQPADSATKSFHFALNNVLLWDTRIPPFGLDRDMSVTRNMLPVPADQYGNPGPGGTFEHWHESTRAIPAGAASVEVRLLYQQTSWEYVQFLWLQNDGLNSFLGQEGVNLLDAWLNTGMSPPLEMATATLALGEPSGASTISAPSCAWIPPGGTDWVAISADPADGIDGIDLELQYDPVFFTATDVRTTAISNDCSVVSNLTTPGTVSASLFCLSTLSGTGPLVEVEFQVAGSAGQSTVLDLTLASADEGAIVTTLVDGLLSISTDADGDGVAAACGDCDDSDAAVYPGAPEVCDGVDNQCPGDPGSGATDEGGDALCDNGLFCDGIEVCGGLAGCQSGVDPCDDGNACTLDTCAEDVGGPVCDNVVGGACGLTGTVRYYRDSGGSVEPSAKGVPAVDIDVASGFTGDGTADATTGPDGTWTATPPAGTVTVTPLDKFGVGGASDENGAISSLDAALVAGSVVDLVTLSTNQSIAGDVTGNGSVSSLDASFIAQYAVGNVEHVPVASTEGSDWAFLRCDNYVDASSQDCAAPVYLHDPLTGPEVDDFYALLYGDVTGNWQPASRTANGESQEAGLMLAPPDGLNGVTHGIASARASVADKDLPVANGRPTVLTQAVRPLGAPRAYLVLLRLSDATGVLGADLELGYDPARFTVTAVRAVDVGATLAVAAHDDAGRLRLGLYGASPLRGSGAIVAITVQATAGTPGPSRPFEIKAVVNEGAIPVSVSLASAPPPETTAPARASAPDLGVTTIRRGVEPPR